MPRSRARRTLYEQDEATRTGRDEWEMKKKEAADRVGKMKSVEDQEKGEECGRRCGER